MNRLRENVPSLERQEGGPCPAFYKAVDQYLDKFRAEIERITEVDFVRATGRRARVGRGDVEQYRHERIARCVRDRVKLDPVHPRASKPSKIEQASRPCQEAEVKARLAWRELQRLFREQHSEQGPSGEPSPEGGAARAKAPSGPRTQGRCYVCGHDIVRAAKGGALGGALGGARATKTPQPGSSRPSSEKRLANGEAN